jgi:single-strand DNA-binding protein
MMNAISLIGRLTKDIELKDVGEGRLVTSNTLAVRKAYKKDGGSDADFIPFVAWGKRAELLEEYCSKGDLIALTGRMQSRSYKTESEDTRYVVEMLVEDLEFLQKKSPDKAAAQPS